jgi:hypothetical protein
MIVVALHSVGSLRYIMTDIDACSGAEPRPVVGAPEANTPRRLWAPPRIIAIDLAKSKAASCSGSDGDIGS